MRLSAWRFFLLLCVCSFLLAPGAKALPEGNWRNYQDQYSKARGNCPDCQDGEAMATASVGVPHGLYVDINDPPCGDPSFAEAELSPEVKGAVAAYFYSQVGPAATFATPIVDSIVSEVARYAGNNEGEIGRAYRRATNQPQIASCAKAIVVLPKSVNVTRTLEGMDCPAGGWCALVGQDESQEIDQNLFAMSITGKNWSHNTAASVWLKVFYRR